MEATFIIPDGRGGGGLGGFSVNPPIPLIFPTTLPLNKMCLFSKGSCDSV